MDFVSSEYGGIPSLNSALNFLSSVTGMSMFATALGTGTFGENLENTSYKLVPILILGYLFTVVKSISQWAFRRFSFQYYITAQFNEGDPTYDWLILLLTNDNVWKKCKDFKVTSKTSQRKWSIGLSTNSNDDGVREEENAEYVPTYTAPQLWRWNGYWIEVTRNTVPQTVTADYYSISNPSSSGSSSIYLTIYTFNMGVLSQLVETARKKYFEVSNPYIIVHSIDTLQPSYAPVLTWNNVKKKNRRPLESIILEDGVLDSILQDAREFISMEEWYTDAGIPHRRGYLLHGPPGTGKSSTIYAVAGELGMEIYSLSLAANFVDDAVLQRAAASIPKNCIFLIEDIDCAFPNREDDDTSASSPYGDPYTGIHGRPRVPGTRSAVTLSGLLNVLDGIGSEEGKLFFATTNYIDHLDAAFLRPGRIDMRVEYKLSSQKQAAALFRRFYPEKHIKLAHICPAAPTQVAKSEALIDHPITTSTQAFAASGEVKVSEQNEKQTTVTERIAEMSESFAEGVPVNEFSTAELQGYLLLYKKDPVKAVEHIASWVQEERRMREEKRKRDEERRAKQQAKALERWGPGGPPGAYGGMVVPPTPPASTPATPIASDQEPGVGKADIAETRVVTVAMDLEGQDSEMEDSKGKEAVTSEVTPGCVSSDSGLALVILDNQ